MHRIGVIPFDINDDDIYMLFITSKTRRRWVPPKGRAKVGESHEDVCHREAFEEAGITGKVLLDFPITVVIGRERDNRIERLPVTYYPFLVEQQSKKWPEKNERKRHWVTLKKAQKIASRKDFGHLFKLFEDLMPWINEASEELRSDTSKKRVAFR